ncbi:hypothetical protein V500_05986 [Pseudogymnoascus sp. VKM F-4518 (FW-2643)]|nr:hypothetical protein V500_05986 [Pseudogymnoascus sp. VKM F-4518 (FW-2643)]
MLFSRFIISALCVGAGLAATTRDVSLAQGQAAVVALKSLQEDVTASAALIKTNVEQIKPFSKDADIEAPVAAIKAAFVEIAASFKNATEAIKAGVPPVASRQLPTDPAAIATEIAGIINNIAGTLLGLFLSFLGTVTASKLWQDFTNPLLEAFTEVMSTLETIPGLNIVLDIARGILNSIPVPGLNMPGFA